MRDTIFETSPAFKLQDFDHVENGFIFKEIKLELEISLN